MKQSDGFESLYRMIVKPHLYMSAESDYELRITGSNVLDVLRLLNASP